MTEMKQDIRFCTTSDGVRIAYATIGQGPPLVRVLGWFTHLEFEFENPVLRRGNQLFSSAFTFSRYDGRGMGLSDRDVSDFSIDGGVRDLEAVVDALGTEKVALFGMSEGGATAITYAVRHPDRVSHLIIYGSFVRPIMSEEQLDTYASFVRQGWSSDLPAHRQFFTSLFLPDGDTDAIKAFNELQGVSASADTVFAKFRPSPRPPPLHLTDLLPQVAVPTLVIHLRGDAVVPFEFGREIAAGIPSARFLPLEGRNHALMAESDAPVAVAMVDAIRQFIGAAQSEDAAPSSSGVVTVLFTDLVGHTEMMSRLGDERGRAVLREHERITREVLKAHGGTEVKTMGDGFMASFGSVTKAVECAMALQKAFAEREGEPLSVRVGLNAGEPIEEEGDLFGATVILTSRIAAKAEGGEILVSDNVRSLCSGKGFLFSDRGEFVAKGFKEPVRVYEVSWRDEAV